MKNIGHNKKDISTIINIFKDDEFINKILYIREILNTTEIEENIRALEGVKLSKDEFQKEINRTRKEVEEGNYLTFDELIRAMDYE